MGGRHFGGMGFMNPWMFFRPGTTYNFATVRNGSTATTTITYTRPTNFTTMNSWAFHHHHNSLNWKNPYFNGMNPYAVPQTGFNAAVQAALYSSLYGGMSGYGGAYIGSAYSANPYVSNLAYVPADSTAYSGYTAAPADAYKPAVLPERVARIVTDATEAEILSGRALNDILADIQKLVARPDAEGFLTVGLKMTDEALDHINVTQGSGNMAILKKDARLPWPTALSGDDLAETQNQLERLVQSAIGEVQAQGKVDPDTLQQITDVVDRLDRFVRQSSMAFDSHVEAKTFLRNLNAAIVALQQPDAQRHFSDTYKLRAATVTELAQKMAENKLKFAAALTDDAASYIALHKVLAGYDHDLRAYVKGKMQTTTP